MNIQENKRFVMDGYQLFKDGDIASLLQRYHDDAEWVGPDSDIVPFAGSYHGKPGIAQFFQRLADSSQATRFEVRECIAEGDKVVAIGDASWVVRATGRTYEVPWTHIFTLRDGKVARFETIYDITAAERAFGGDQGARPAKGSSLHH